MANQSGIPVLELCAGALLNRCSTEKGHLLILTPTKASADDLAGFRGHIEMGLRFSNVQAVFEITEHTVVKDLTTWLYATDLGQGALERRVVDDEDDLDASKQSMGGFTRGASGAVYDAEDGYLHFKRRIGFVHNLHRASAEVQSFLIGALQLNTLYGSGERSLKLVTIIATADVTQMPLLSQRLRERFSAAAIIDNEVSPLLDTVLDDSVHALLAEDMVKTSEAIFGVAGEVYPPSGVYVNTAVEKYIMECVAHCRMSPACGVLLPTHSLIPHFLRAVKVYAKVSRGRDYATPEDVRRVLPHLLFHRLFLKPKLVVNDDMKNAGGGGGVAGGGDSLAGASGASTTSGILKDSSWAYGSKTSSWQPTAPPLTLAPPDDPCAPSGTAEVDYMNEDLMHGLLATMYTNQTGSNVCAGYNRQAAIHNWRFACSIISRQAVPL